MLVPLGLGHVASGDVTRCLDPVVRVEVPDDDAVLVVDGQLHAIGTERCPSPVRLNLAEFDRRAQLGA